MNKLILIILTALCFQLKASINQLFTNKNFNSVFGKFPINLIGSKNNIYQIRVQNQFDKNDNCPIPDAVFGLTCGRHAFKNSILGLLALEAYEKQNVLRFNSSANGLINLTNISQCLFKEINLKIEEFREQIEQDAIDAGLPIPEFEQTLSPEEVDYVLNNIHEITKKCNLPELKPENFAFIYFPPEGIQNFIKGQYAKQLMQAINLIHTNQNARVSILLLIPGHWINVIVNKTNGNLEFIIFDSMNSNRINNKNVNALINLVTDFENIKVQMEQDEKEYNEIAQELRVYSKLKDDIYQKADLKQIVHKLRKIANQNKFKDLNRQSSFLLAKIYFNGGESVNRNLNLAKYYALKADKKNSQIILILDELKKIEQKAKAELIKKQFQNTSKILSEYAQTINAYNAAVATKNLNIIKKLEPKINEIKQSLLKVPINLKNEQDQTALMLNPAIAPIVYAVDKKRAGYIVNAKDANGKTVLQYVINSSYADKIYIYKALKEGGFTFTKEDIEALQNKLKNNPNKLQVILKILRG